MKFTIETQILAAALRKASAAISDRNLLPILGNVKIEAQGEQIIVSSANLDIFVIQKLPAAVAEDGAVTVPHGYLSKLADRSQSTGIRISTDAKTLKFESGEIEATLEILSADEFPPPFKIGEGTECEADSITLPFEKLGHAMSKDEHRYMLLGINILSEKEGTEFCASDGRRIALFKTENIKLGGIVPSELVAAVLKMDFSGVVKVSTESGIFSMSSDTITVSGKLVEGRYVNYRQVIPTETPKDAFAVNRKDLIEALRTCAIFTERQMTALEIRGKGKKQIEVRKDNQATVSVMSAELSNVPQITIRFDSRFMLDALNACEDEVVRIQCIKEADAIHQVMIEERAYKEVIGLLRAP